MLQTYNYKKENTDKLNAIQKAIIKYIGCDPLMFAGRNYILFSWCDCGNDEKLAAKLTLMEKLVDKHFQVVRKTAYLGQSDFTLNCDIV